MMHMLGMHNLNLNKIYIVFIVQIKINTRNEYLINDSNKLNIYYIISFFNLIFVRYK
jgi:hypothetical protein